MANNNQLIIATEAGVYTTQLANGASTIWTPSPGFPTVRTDMLKIRLSDRLVAAATHGRGLFTTTIDQALPINNINLQGTLAGEGIAQLNWTTRGETNATKYVLQYSADGVTFNRITELPYNVKQFRHSFQASVGYYRIMGYDPNHAAVFSNVVAINNTGRTKVLEARMVPNPVTTGAAAFTISSPQAGAFNWTLFDMQGRMLQTGNGTLTAGGSQSQNINTSKLPAGMYRIRLMQGSQSTITAFTKQ